MALGNWRVLDCKKKQAAAVSDRDSGLREARQQGENGGRLDGQATTWPQDDGMERKGRSWRQAGAGIVAVDWAVYVGRGGGRG